MDKHKLASDLVKIAKELIGMDVNSFMDMLKTIEVDWAEGNIKTGIATLKGKKFKNVRDFEKALRGFDYPESGYDKVGIKLIMNDGSELTKFRYDHGSHDESFKKQFEYYIKHNVTFEE